MANSRIFIRCCKCEKEILLFKYFPSSRGLGYLWPSPQKLEEFILEHLEECYLPEQDNWMFFREEAPFKFVHWN